MQFRITYDIEKKLKSISERLKYLTKDTNVYYNQINQNIISENLQFNISLILSHVIINLKFADRSEECFTNEIIEFNKMNNTNLKFKDFEDLFWIRIINGEIKIPEKVRQYIWKVGNNESKKITLNIPEEKINFVRCLQIFYQKYYENSRLTITKDKLEHIIHEYALREININFLEVKKIISFNPKENNYFWEKNSYLLFLGNEIAATLWLLLCSEDPNEINFRKYLKVILGQAYGLIILKDI